MATPSREITVNISADCSRFVDQFQRVQQMLLVARIRQIRRMLQILEPLIEAQDADRHRMRVAYRHRQLARRRRNRRRGTR